MHPLFLPHGVPVLSPLGSAAALVIAATLSAGSFGQCSGGGFVNVVVAGWEGVEVVWVTASPVSGAEDFFVRERKRAL